MMIEPWIWQSLIFNNSLWKIILSISLDWVNYENMRFLQHIIFYSIIEHPTKPHHTIIDHIILNLTTSPYITLYPTTPYITIPNPTILYLVRILCAGLQYATQKVEYFKKLTSLQIDTSQTNTVQQSKTRHPILYQIYNEVHYITSHLTF